MLRNAYRKDAVIYSAQFLTIFCLFDKGVFKPIDEEPFAPNNPKGYKGKFGTPGFRASVLSGEAAVREVAAYFLDDKGFFDVPPTTFVELYHPYFANRELTEDDFVENFTEILPTDSHSALTNKTIKQGSLQKFIDGAEEASDYGCSCFPDDEVHKIAILDILILNCDRNEGNILVKRHSTRKFVLIPIDHGLSFPDSINICSYEIIWTDWPQIQKPFSEREIAFINTLNPREDTIKLSKYLKFRDVCLRNFRIASTVLVKFANANLTIADIVGFLYKDEPDLVSPIEELILKAESMKATRKNSIRDLILPDMKKEKKLQLLDNPAKKDAFEEEKKENETNGTKRTSLLRPNRILSDILEETDMLDFTDTNAQLESLKPSGKSDPITFFRTESHESGGSDIIPSLPEDDVVVQLDELDSPGLKKREKPRLFISRNVSMPNMTNVERLHTKAIPELKEEFMEREKSKKRLSSKLEEIPSYLDDIFFHYFEEFLDQEVSFLVKTKEKRLSK